MDPRQCQKIEVEPDKFINISSHIEGELQDKYIALLIQYKDVFAWSPKDLKGIPPYLGEHRIDLVEGAIRVRQRQYMLNPKYSMLVKEELDKLTTTGFIYPVLNVIGFCPLLFYRRSRGQMESPRSEYAKTSASLTQLLGKIT